MDNIQIQRAYSKRLLVTRTANCFSYVNCAALSKHDIDIRLNVLTKHGTLFDLRLNGDLYIHPSKSVIIPLGGILLDSGVA